MNHRFENNTESVLLDAFVKISSKTNQSMGKIATWSTIFLVIEFVVCLLGIFFNALVILIIFKNISRLAAPSFLVLSIAISDLLSCSVAVPFSIAAHFQNEWPFGMAGCRAHAFMVFLFALVSITHLAAISAGKYLTISRSLSRESYLSKKQVLFMILGTWLYSLGFSVAPLIGWSRYGFEGTNATCSIKWDSSRPSDKAYFGVVFIACFFLPMGVITVCYHKIHNVSKRIVNNAQRQISGHLAMTRRQALLKKHRKSAMYFLAIIAVFMLAWSPYAVVSLLVVLLGKTLDAIATSACSVFAKISFVLNPILYAIFSRKFRRKIALVVPIARPNQGERRPAVNVSLPSTSQPFAL